MTQDTRRTFLADVGRGMLAGSLGTALAGDLGLSPLRAEGDVARLTFGEMEPLVALMQETPLDRLQRVLVDKMQAGTDLKTLVKAGTLANARSFGGQDYIGYHTFMALAPALDMSERLPEKLKPLPVLKVLYRNTERIHANGGVSAEKLHPIPSGKFDGRADGKTLRAATRAGDQQKAEQILAAMSDQPRGEIFNHVQYAVQDSVNVHRVVLAWRAWLAVDLVGEEHAQSLLRQSVRFCTDTSKSRIEKKRPDPELWTLIQKLLDEHQLIGRRTRQRDANDKWVQELAATIFSSSRAQAADAAAQALAEGYTTDDVGEAISIAANMLLLHDPGRQKAANYDKVVGSVHGDSVGVHACDAANAWRNIARVSNPRNAIVSTIVGAYHTAGQMSRVGQDDWPLKHDAVERIDDRHTVLKALKDAVRDKDQALAGAAVKRWQELGGTSQPVFGLMLRFATTEDGALHAEKFFRTVTEEFATTRESLRWRQLIGLARVTASEYGTKPPGFREACDILKVHV